MSRSVCDRRSIPIYFELTHAHCYALYSYLLAWETDELQGHSTNCVRIGIFLTCKARPRSSAKRPYTGTVRHIHANKMRLLCEYRIEVGNFGLYSQETKGRKCF